MKNLMEKHTIIKLKQQGYSNRKVSKMIGVDRKTIAKYWNEFNKQIHLLGETAAPITDIQETIVSKPKYDSSNRKPSKYTQEIDQRLDEILLEERRKDQLLGSHKQKLTKYQVHKILEEEGFNIGYTTIAVKVNQKTNKNKECFIKQTYEYGDRLEYDFGEVK